MPIENKMMRIIGMALFENLHETSMTFSDEEFSKMYSIAEKHDITNIVGYSLKQLGILPNNDFGKQFERKIAESYYRFLRIEKTATEIYAQFDKNKIEYIPLKGAVIRALYPEPWLRTSCDIDVLVKEDELQRALGVLEELDGYKRNKQCTMHDIAVTSNSGVHIEVHYALMNRVENLMAVPWEYVVKQSEYCYAMTNDYLYTYIISHGAKHFFNGGCGAKTLLDVIFIRKNIKIDKETTDNYLKISKLLEFEKQLVLLAENLLFGKELSELQECMKEFIFNGGVYGGSRNKRRVGQCKESRAGYIFKRIWLPYIQLAERYPKLKNRKALIPYYQVARWVKCLFGKNIKNNVYEVRNAVIDSDENIEKIHSMISQLEL